MTLNQEKIEQQPVFIFWQTAGVCLKKTKSDQGKCNFKKNKTCFAVFFFPSILDDKVEDFCPLVVSKTILSHLESCLKLFFTVLETFTGR